MFVFSKYLPNAYYAPNLGLRAGLLLLVFSFQSLGSVLNLLEAARNSVLPGTGLHTSSGLG